MVSVKQALAFAGHVCFSQCNLVAVVGWAFLVYALCQR
jgi:hypothetical protein